MFFAMFFVVFCRFFKGAADVKTIQILLNIAFFGGFRRGEAATQSFSPYHFRVFNQSEINFLPRFSGI